MLVHLASMYFIAPYIFAGVSLILSVYILYALQDLRQEEEIQEISFEEGMKIIDIREPRGLFIVRQDEMGKWIGLDNTTGDCWTESFKNKRDCIEWLKGRG